MHWKIDLWFFRIALTLAVISTLVAYLMLLGSYQEFQEETMRTLLKFLRVLNFVGTGCALSVPIYRSSDSRRLLAPSLFLFLLFIIWETLAAAWKVWLYA